VETKSFYSKAMIEDCIDFLWKHHGIAVGTQDFMWNNDKVIEEAIKLGYNVSFGDF
jgi:hypothetical protein